MRTAAALFVVAVVVVACGSTGDGGDDAADARARRLVAAFRCPASAGLGLDPLRLAGRRLRVVTSVAPITSVVAAVAGDRADVRGVIPEGVDSHTYEPRPSDAVALERADIVVLNGLGLEDSLAALARRRQRPRRIVQLGDEALPPRAWLYDDTFPRSGGRPNPHLWTNPPMAACYATIAARVLAASDPAGAATYEANARAFRAAADRLDGAMRTATRTLPRRRRVLLTYHDAYAYVAVEYGWRVVGAVQPSSIRDPSPKDVARLIRQVEDEDVPAVFGSEVFPSPVLAQLARETGARYVDELRDDDLPGEPGDPEHSLLGLLRFDFVTMVRGLGGDAAALEEVPVG